MPEKRPDEAWRELLRERLRSLPRDYSAAKREVLAIQHAVFEEVVGPLAERLNEQLASMPKTSIEECQDVATWCNGELHELRFAIKDVGSERTGVLVVDAPHDTGRFRLHIRDEQGGVSRVTLPALLTPLTLAEAPIRREPFARGPRDGRRGR